MKAKGAPDAGFTLVEVLVVLVLISSVIALATTAWIGMTGRKDRVEAGFHALVDDASRRAIFRSQLAMALPWIDRENGSADLRFAGTSQGLEFVSARPAFEPGSAYRLWRWRLTQEGGQNALEAALNDWHVKAFDEPEEPSWRVLMTFDELPAFVYLDRSTGEPRWLSDWEENDRLPDAVMLKISNRPPLLVELRQQTQIACVGQAAIDNENCL